MNQEKKIFLHENDLYNFLSTNDVKFLVIETGLHPLLVSVSVTNLIKFFAEKYTQDPVLNRYFTEENQLRTEWVDIVSTVKSSNSFPEFKRLVIIEFYQVTELTACDREILDKITEHFKLSTVEKVIYIFSHTSLLDEYLKTFKTCEFWKINVFRNKISPALYADEHALLKDAEELIKNGGDVNLPKDECGNTPLHFAAEKGNIDLVLTLLKCGAKIASNKNRNNPLHLAAKFGHKDIVTTFLKHNADVNITNNEGAAALHFAAVNGHPDIVLALLQSNANIDIPNCYNQTALSLSAFYGHKDVVQILLNKNANVNIKDYMRERTALHWASKNGHEDVVLALLKHNPEVNIRDYKEQTALHHAARNGYRNVTLALLKNDASINIQNMFGWTPLHYAAINGHEDVVIALLESNAIITIQNYRNRTVLHEAAAYGYKDMVSIFLRHGVNVNIKTNNQQRKEQHEEMDVNSMKLKSDRHYNISLHGHTALHFAAFGGQKEVVLSLLESGADVNAKNDDERTALDFAITSERNEILKILLEHVEDVNGCDFYGTTGLHEATCQKSTPIVETLLDYGADINVKNGNNDTPLHLAAFNGYAEIFQLLQERGADVTVKNKQNLTPFQLKEKMNDLPLEHLEIRREYHTACCVLPLTDRPNGFLYVDPDFELPSPLLRNIPEERRRFYEGITE